MPLGTSRRREIVLQVDIPIIIIGVGLETDFESTRERSRQDDQGRACGQERRVD